MAILRKAAVSLGTFAVVGALLLLGGIIFNGTVSAVTSSDRSPDEVNAAQSRQLFERGKQIFRFDTFGDQAFWGGALQLHKAIEGEKLGGVGPGVSPKTALAVGLKVDVNALPQSVRDAIAQGTIDLNDPATTLALFKLDAVIGLKGFSTTRAPSPRLASRAPSATRQWMTRSHRGSGVGSTAGRTAISTSGPS
jgi:hypothetical protein